MNIQQVTQGLKALGITHITKQETRYGFRLVPYLVEQILTPELKALGCEQDEDSPRIFAFFDKEGNQITMEQAYA